MTIHLLQHPSMYRSGANEHDQDVGLPITKEVWHDHNKECKFSSTWTNGGLRHNCGAQEMAKDSDQPNQGWEES